jgi:uncharacterized membrane protein YesL
MPANTNPPAITNRVPAIRIAFRTAGRTLRHSYEHLGTLVITSLLWYISAALVLPVGVATAGLHRVMQPVSEERTTDWRRMWEHARADLRWSSLLMAALVGGVFVIINAIGFYSGSTNSVIAFLAILFGTGLIVWIGIAFFAFPLALRQEEPGLRTTLRNSLIMVAANAPGVLVSLVLLLIVSVILVVLPPLFVVLPGVIALWSEENARLLLVASGYIPPDEVADRPRKR